MPYKIGNDPLILVFRLVYPLATNLFQTAITPFWRKVFPPHGPGPSVISSGPPGIKTTAVPFRGSTKLILIGPPEPPLDVEVEDINGMNIKIMWTMSRDNGSPATKCYIEARTTFDLDNWERIATSNVTYKPRQSTIVRLSPWVEYKIRVVAENKYGLSKPSLETEKWIRTPTAKPQKYPTKIMGNGTGPNELTISFQPLDEMDQNAPGIQYIVYHRMKDGTREMVPNTVPKGKNFIRLTFQATDSFYKPYEFQVQAKNDNGYGPKSPVYVAFTGERTPIVVPKNLHVKIVSSTNAVASWDSVSKSRNTMRGRFIGYKFLYWVKPKTGHPRLEQYLASFSTTVNVKLKPFTQYYFQVMAFNKAGDGPGSQVYGPLEMPEGKPSAPQQLSVTDASEGQATLTWNEPLHKNGILTQYLLTYQSLPSGNVYEKELSTDETFIMLSNLVPNAKYTFKIAAITIAGMGEYAQVNFDFSKVPSQKMEAPKIASIGYNAVVLSWSPISTERISGYKVFYWKAGETGAKAIALWEENDDIVTTIANLDSDATYYFQLAVVNRYGTGPRSKIAEARTKINKNATPKPTPISDKRSSSIKLTFTNYVILVFTLIAILIPR